MNKPKAKNIFNWITTAGMVVFAVSFLPVVPNAFFEVGLFTAFAGASVNLFMDKTVSPPNP